uniref:Uncharacterized protein n=1 Tax=Rhizophora mucronata TaxID=61149 RepID=A0A2P2IJG2_RHIMU
MLTCLQSQDIIILLHIYCNTKHLYLCNELTVFMSCPFIAEIPKGSSHVLIDKLLYCENKLK